MSIYFILIISKNKNSINKFFIHFFDNKNLNFNNIKKFCKKTEDKKILSILKSPHINKKAQEQFETRTFYKQFVIQSVKNKKYFIFLKKIITNLFSDINIKIKLTFNKNNKKKNYLNTFNLDNFKKKKNTQFLIKKTKIKIKISNVYGKNMDICSSSSVGRA